MRRYFVWLMPLLSACAAAMPAVAPVPSPISPAHGTVLTPDRTEAALAAFRAGLMPLHATGVDAFAQLHPSSDGRGILIGILDSGIDPSVPGLERTSEGARKIVALRDFSGEGDVALHPAELIGDLIALPGHAVAGRARLAALASGQLYVGLLPEVQFGNGGGADLSGNGIVGDTLLIVVARGTNDWFAMIDSDLDGTVADEVPIVDFDRSGGWSGWSADSTQLPRTPIALTLSEHAGIPRLTVVFDADGHGTHVAGVAAGFGLYGVEGFNGVAPGARLLGLKIASNGAGGVTTTGSLVRAITYAVELANDRRMPLVLNLSFGVGNQREGAALLDGVVDSILAANPGLVLTVAAGNDGPGLSSLGFPATASHVLSIGATSPLVFAGLGPGSAIPDPVAHYSSRGGERTGPDLVAPGTAWSTVPAYNAGTEELTGTSMAAPHVAGLLARLMSWEQASGRVPDRRRVQQSLLATSRPVPFASVLDQGAGVPDLLAAFRWLEVVRVVPFLEAQAVDGSRNTGVWFDGEVLPERILVRIERRDAPADMRIRLRTTVPWLVLEGDPVRTVAPGGVLVALHLEPAAHLTPGVRVGALLVEDADDEGLGILRRVPVTIRRPMSLDGDVRTLVAMQAGETGREVVDADSGRALEITVETLSRNGLALVGLHEGGGQPGRDRVLTAAGYAGDRAVIRVPGDDVQRGRYEVSLVASATLGVAARVGVRQAPVRLDAELVADSLRIAATSMVREDLELRLLAEWIGAEARHRVTATAAAPQRLPVAIPSWAATLRLDVDVPTEDWPRFTDFGVTLRDRAGRLLAESPLTYAFGRMRYALPAHLRGDTVYVVLAPAAVGSSPETPWESRIAIRFLDVAAVQAGPSTGSAPFSLTPGERRTMMLPTDGAARTPDARLAPLLRVTAIDGDGTRWIKEFTPARGKD